MTSTHISYCHFNAFTIFRLYISNEAVFIQKHNKKTLCVITIVMICSSLASLSIISIFSVVYI